MSQYDTNSRVTFPRSSETGRAPTRLKHGGLAVNLADKKIYVGDPGDSAVRFAQWLDDWSTQIAYKEGDFALYQGSIVRSLVDQITDQPFNDTLWERITKSDDETLSEPYSSDMIEGGRVSVDTVTSVLVEAGTGVIADNTTPKAPTTVEVTWPAFTLSLTYLNENVSALAINSSGVAQHVAASAWNAELRRDHILLSFVFWSSAGEIKSVIGGSRRAGGTAETYIDEYAANGGPYRAQGVKPFTVTGNRQFGITEGVVFSMGNLWRTEPKNPNLLTVPALSPVPFLQVSQRGIEGTETTSIDVLQYDNGTTLAAIPSGQATIQYIYAAPDFSQFYVQYGQTLYASVTEANQNIEEDYAAFVKPITPDVSILIGAVLAKENVDNFDDPLLGLIVNARRGADPFSNQGAFDDSNFYLLDGSRELTGDMSAGGNAIVNAEIDGMSNAIKPARSETTGVGLSGLPEDYGELFINLTDRKIYVVDSTGGERVVADRIDTYSTQRQYVVGDFCLYNDGGGDDVYVCNTPVTSAQPFDPAKWTNLTGGTSTEAILTGPQAPGRNTIGTNGFPAVEPLKILGDSNQTADLITVEGTASSDAAEGWGVDALGFPKQRNGAASWRQDFSGPHGLQVGQPVTFDGSVWRGAGAGDTVIAAVDQVIDTARCTLRAAGRMTNLNAAAFAGGATPIAGTTYYTSATPGVLTPTPGGNPVLVATSGTTGVLIIGTTDAEMNGGKF